MTVYPGAIDSFLNPGPTTDEDAAGYEHDEQHANANDAITAIETELGTDPRGSHADVAARLNAMGLVFVDSGTFSAVASETLPSNIFDGTYDDYLVRARITGSTNIQVTCRLHLTGTGDASTNYNTTRAIHYSNTGAGQTNALGTDEFQVCNCGGGGAPGTIDLNLISPAIAEITSIDCSSQSYYNTTDYFTARTSGVHNAATAYDTLTLLADTGTISGRWTVYGWRKG